jgi:endonuclease-3
VIKVWKGKIEAKQRQMREIIQRLEKHFPGPHDVFIKQPFPLLIATILSQNTSDMNSRRAFHSLEAQYAITPDVLASLSPEEIQPYIRIAGLYRIRSQRIIEVSKIILEQFQGSLRNILNLPIKNAREQLLKIPGIGPKTADILIAFIMKQPTMPIDTNIFRVALRIGIVKGRKYQLTQKALEELIPKKKMQIMHLLLIQHGREICKPRIPLCQRCPIDEYCDYPLKT